MDNPIFTVFVLSSIGIVVFMPIFTLMVYEGVLRFGDLTIRRRDRKLRKSESDYE